VGNDRRAPGPEPSAVPAARKRRTWHIVLPLALSLLFAIAAVEVHMHVHGVSDPGIPHTSPSVLAQGQLLHGLVASAPVSPVQPAGIILPAPRGEGFGAYLIPRAHTSLQRGPPGTFSQSHP